jgi:signal transduction histidine kinase
VTVRGEFVPIPGDEGLLRQALSNLCRNALEACVEARMPPHITIEGALDPAGQSLRISVIDQGPGVDPNLAGKVFQPFVTTRARGTGLGLAVVQKIVVTHNGRVSLHSDPGGGARFTMTLPLGSIDSIV